jgi:hypothetical protein
LRGGEIIIAVDHACMNKLKEKKPKNYDATELLGREFQSPYQAFFIPAPPARPSKTTTLVKNDLDIY